MKKHVVGFLLILVGPSLAGAIQSSSEWIKYTSTEGQYVVSLPAQPKVSTQEATAGTGDKFQQYLAAVTEAGDVVYLIGYFDRLPGTVFSADVARDSMVKRINGTLISEAPISLDGFSGKEMKVLASAAAGSEYIVRARFYETDNRIYILQFIVPKPLESDALTARGTKYLNSFHIVKN